MGDFNSDPYDNGDPDAGGPSAAQVVPRALAFAGGGALVPAFPLPASPEETAGPGATACGAAGPGAEPPTRALWSTWKRRGAREVKHLIDYILVDGRAPGALAPVRWLAPPAAADVPPGRLPCAGYPSDHLAVAADVAFD